MNKPSRKHIILFGITLAVFAVSASKIWYLHTHEDTDDAQIEAHVLPVLPRVSGFVDRVYVSDEEAVKQGDTLFTIDNRELLIKFRQTEADYMAALAASKTGVAGASVQVAESQKASAEANYQATQVELDKTSKNVARIRELAAKQIASKSQLDEAEAAFQAASARLQAASTQVEGSGFGTVSANAQVRLADARLAAAKANLDAAKLQLSYSVVIAPQNGHIAKKNLEVGQLLSAGQPVMSIVMDDKAWVVANFKETQIQNIHSEQKVDIEIDAYPGRVFRGKVGTIQYATGSRFSLLPPDNASGNFTKVVQRIPVRILIDSTETNDVRILPGMSAVVSIPLRD